MEINDPAKEELVKKFRAAVTLACPSLVTLKEQRVMRGLPLSMFEKAFSDVFQNDLKLARDVMLERVDDSIDLAPEKEVRKIAGVETFKFPNELGKFDCIIVSVDHKQFKISSIKLKKFISNCKLIIDHDGAWKNYNLNKNYHLSGDSGWM